MEVPPPEQYARGRDSQCVWRSDPLPRLHHELAVLRSVPCRWFTASCMWSGSRRGTRGKVPAELVDLVEGHKALPAGQALDIGCGTGTQAVYLASQGWEVTGIDVVQKPLRQARARSIASGVSVRWVRGDVARLSELGVTPGCTLVFDRGCFHGLNAQQQAAYAGV